MTPATRLAAALAAVLSLAGPSPAQEIRGAALDEQGEPLPEVPVALHRVGAAGGASVAAAVTDAEGRFRFEVEPADSALYFVAMRYRDAIYIGPPARGGSEAITDYQLRADPSAEAGRVASALGGAARPGPLPAGASVGQGGGAPGPGGSGRAAWLVALLAVAAAATFVTAAPGYRDRRRRDLLVELAAAENRLAEGGLTTDRADLARRRDSLRERLAPRV